MSTSLYKYFKREGKGEEEPSNDGLPDPKGELSGKVPSRSILSANKEVRAVLNASKPRKRLRGSYDSFTPEEKAKIAKKAIENGITKTAVKYNRELQDRTLKESTVCTWVSEYRQQLELRRCTGIELSFTVSKLEDKKRGRPLLLGEELHQYTHLYVAELRGHGGVINTEIVSAAAIGIVKNFDANMLQINGGHIACGHEWAKGLLKRMGYVKRRANTKSKVTVEEFEALKTQFIFDIEVISQMEEVPNDLIINWDHTGINYVPTSNWTMAEEGSS